MSKKTALLLSLLFVSVSALPSAYYVAVDGSDQNPGTLRQPFATVQNAQRFVNAGDTVYIRGGNYIMQESQIARKQGIYSYVTDLNKSGSENARINYWAYPGETPVFNYTNVKPSTRVRAFYV